MITRAMRRYVIKSREQNSWIGRGTVELQTMNMDRAISDFRKPAQIAPSPLASYWLGRAL
jgi:hypothetical protein